MEARIIVYTPLRVYSQAERVARDAAMLYTGVCKVNVTVVPILDPEAELEVSVEGDEACALPVAEVVQGLLWLVDSSISSLALEPLSIYPGVVQQIAVEA